MFPCFILFSFEIRNGVFVFSAGVGRTGTLIVIDAMLNQIRDENIIDVYKFVSKIRRQRNFMVQTEVTMKFIIYSLVYYVYFRFQEIISKS